MNFEQLKADVEALLEKAAETKKDFGVVNWGDLGVRDIERRQSVFDGPACIVVLIEEASLDCNLPDFLYENLKDKYPNVYFECEW
jgi:hypothetical protein